MIEFWINIIDIIVIKVERKLLSLIVEKAKTNQSVYDLVLSILGEFCSGLNSVAITSILNEDDLAGNIADMFLQENDAILLIQCSCIFIFSKYM